MKKIKKEEKKKMGEKEYKKKRKIRRKKVQKRGEKKKSNKIEKKKKKKIYKWDGKEKENGAREENEGLPTIKRMWTEVGKRGTTCKLTLWHSLANDSSTALMNS